VEPDESVGALEELTVGECLALLADREVGRLAVVVEGQPVIFPVNYVLDGETVVFRNDPGSKLAHAGLDRVAFEVDELYPDDREGWSIVVTGTGREFSDAIDDASVRERSLRLAPWVGGEKAHWVRIVRAEMTGRRLRRIATPDEERPGGRAPCVPERTETHRG
jgi:nitroimidazol reductase NimA-like FMN-containing flavoprotein (pyridoxamine 5'-phosphate oxidase superfamily)